MKMFNWLGGVILASSILIAVHVVPHYLGDSLLSFGLQFLCLVLGAFGVSHTNKHR